MAFVPASSRAQYTRDAFITFASAKEARRALTLHGARMGSRFISVIMSSTARRDALVYRLERNGASPGRLRG